MNIGRFGFAFILLTFSVSSLGSDRLPRAEDVLTQAQTEATKEHKNIFLIFSSRYCGPCRELEEFLGNPKINSIITKHFVVARLPVAEESGTDHKPTSPGADELAHRYGGVWGSIPFFVFLDSSGQLIINSNRPAKNKPEGENIGYPATAEEIEWFLNMLRKGAPSITGDDLLIIETVLRSAS